LTVRHGIARGRDASCPDQALPRRALLFALSLAAIPLSAWAQAPGDDREQLRKRIDDLEQRVRELESTSVLSEPETRVKRIETWVDDDGVEHDTPAPGTRRVVTYQRERVYRRQTINEKIEDALSDAEGRRVQLGVNAAIVLQSARQAEGSDTQADGNAYQLASTDLYFTAGLARYTVFFADIVGLSGTPSDAEINGLTLLNGYTARLVEQNQLNLREAWLLTELWSQQLTLVAGRVDLTNYFDNNAAANDETAQFLSDALVNNPTLGLSENGAGVAAWYDRKTGFKLKFGYQQSSSTATNLSDALFFLSEADYQWTPPGLGEGNYRLWYRNDNSNGDDRSASGVSIDQKISAAVTLFGRYGSAESPAGRDRFYSGGAQFRRGVVFNPDDAWGIGYARYALGAGDEERLIEFYYNLGIARKLHLSVNLIYVTEAPAGTESVAYFVPGARLQAAF